MFYFWFPKLLKKLIFFIFILDSKLLKKKLFAKFKNFYFILFYFCKINNKILIKFMHKNNILSYYITVYLSNFIQFS